MKVVMDMNDEVLQHLHTGDKITIPLLDEGADLNSRHNSSLLVLVVINMPPPERNLVKLCILNHTVNASHVVFVEP